MFSKLLIVTLYIFSKLIFMIPPHIKIIPASATVCTILEMNASILIFSNFIEFFIRPLIDDIMLNAA
jgi:hypothetical protein